MPGGKKETRELAAVALASGKSNADAGTAAGVSEKTINNWKRDPEFRERIDQLQSEMVRDAVGIVTTNMTKAANKLAELIDSTKPEIALKASLAMLQLGVEMKDNADIRKQLDELEAELRERPRGR